MNNPSYEELRQTLDDLYQGRRVVVPHDIDHAHHMLMLAGAYIQDHRNRVIHMLQTNLTATA